MNDRKRLNEKDLMTLLFKYIGQLGLNLFTLCSGLVYGCQIWLGFRAVDFGQFLLEVKSN